MTKTVTINIDGAFIEAVKSASVLDAALDSGICIPHLCRVPYIEDFGGCRLCIACAFGEGFQCERALTL